jgi:hypothetical protein
MTINKTNTINERTSSGISNPLSAAHLQNSKPIFILTTPLNIMIFTE